MSRSTPQPERQRPGPWPTLVAESWTHRTVEERARAIESACKAAIQLLADAPDREARLRRTDPLPATTRAHLRRLAASDA